MILKFAPCGEGADAVAEKAKTAMEMNPSTRATR